jgi:hypothetical protein
VLREVSIDCGADGRMESVSPDLIEQPEALQRYWLRLARRTTRDRMAAHRKLDRSRDDLWADTVLKCGGALPLFSLRLDSEMLLFALEKQPIEQQQDHGAVIETHEQTGDFKQLRTRGFRHSRRPDFSAGTQAQRRAPQKLSPPCVRSDFN